MILFGTTFAGYGIALPMVVYQNEVNYMNARSLPRNAAPSVQRNRQDSWTTKPRGPEHPGQTPKALELIGRAPGKGISSASHGIAKLLLEHAGTFLERSEAVRAAMETGMPLAEIEQYLDWLDMMRGPAVPTR